MSQCIIIGIDEVNKESLNKCFTLIANKANYGFQSSGDKWTRNNSISYGESCSTGDVLEMILSYGILSYSINGKNYGKCYQVEQDENLQYVMAVSLYRKNDKITLLNYSNSNDDNKQNNDNMMHEAIIQSLKEEVSKKQNKIKSLENKMQQLKVYMHIVY